MDGVDAEVGRSREEALILAIPMKLPSVANQRIHWATKARQVKAQRQAVEFAWLTMADRYTWEIRFDRFLQGSGIEVTLTRIAPRALDSDNLASAFKAIRDEVAKRLWVNDNDPRVTWSYGQGKGSLSQGKSYTGVHIGIWARDSVVDDVARIANGLGR